MTHEHKIGVITLLGCACDAPDSIPEWLTRALANGRIDPRQVFAKGLGSLPVMSEIAPANFRGITFVGSSIAIGHTPLAKPVPEELRHEVRTMNEGGGGNTWSSIPPAYVYEPPGRFERFLRRIFG